MNHTAGALRSTVKVRQIGRRPRKAAVGERLAGGIVALLRSIRAHPALYLLLIPGIAYFVIFHYIPMGGLVIAFKDYRFRDGVFGSAWVGLKNFRILFRNPEFLQIFRNTFVISFLKLFWGFPAPIGLALLLNELRLRAFERTVQTIAYFPHFLSWVVIGGIVFKYFANSGVINSVLARAGLGPIPFLTSTRFFRSIIVLSAVWRDMGWGAIIYLAALSGIDEQLYEAAIIDGAGRWRQTWHVTLPGIRSTIIILLILRMGRIMDVDFEQIFVLYNPFVYSVADVFQTYVYRAGIQGGRFSYSTAVGMFQSVIGLVFVVSANRLANRFGGYGVW